MYYGKTEDIEIDKEAKLRINLKKLTDNVTGTPYYVGKLQLNMIWDMNTVGTSFMVFVSEEGVEELQIGILDPNKTGFNADKMTTGSFQHGKLTIDLAEHQDNKGRAFYIGECMGPIIIPLVRPGVFFSIFIGGEYRDFTRVTGYDPDNPPVAYKEPEIVISNIDHVKRIEREQRFKRGGPRLDDQDGSKYVTNS